MFLILFYDVPNVYDLISCSSSFSEPSLHDGDFCRQFGLHSVYNDPQHYFAGMRDEADGTVVRTFLKITFFRHWNKNCPAPVPWPFFCVPDLDAQFP